MSIKRFFQVVGSVILVFILGSGMFLYSLSSKVKDEIDEAVTHVIPSLLNFSDLKDSVIEIQRYTTDTAVTKNKESI